MFLLTIPFYLLVYWLASSFSDRCQQRVEDCKFINKCLDEFINELGGKTNNKPKYRMKEVEDDGELFFTDATDFNEAFKL